ncbi:hypothetical protein MRX96_031922 [Rhipicephalus microplus]
MVSANRGRRPSPRTSTNRWTTGTRRQTVRRSTLGEEAPDPAAGDDEGHTEGAASEGDKPLRRREARGAAGGDEEPDADDDVSEDDVLTWRTCRAGAHSRAAPDGPAWSTWASQVVGQAALGRKRCVAHAKATGRRLRSMARAWPSPGSGGTRAGT